MFRLECAVQRYAWGSPDHIPELLGVAPDGRPAAELWMGAHPVGPATVRRLVPAPDGATDDLDGASLLHVLERAPEHVLGADLHGAYGRTLPYLFKVLAVARPLSLQVHPDAEHARAGFAREERLGLPLDHPHRSFKDAQHKPEMVVALSRFEGLSGFRAPRRVLELLDGLDGALATRLRELLHADPDDASLHDAFHHLLTGASAADVAELAAACAARLEAGSPSPDADRTVVDLAARHPGDPGAAASLFLNRVTLEPGEAMYVPAGSVHAYLDGFALEVMAGSDNVLRAGLTDKHVDVDALLECTHYVSGPPNRPAPVRVDAWTTEYRAPVAEFALALSRPAGAVAPLPAGGPRVVLCLEGEVGLTTAAGTATLRRGDVVLVSDADGAAQVRGTGEVATAFTPAPAGSAAADGAPSSTAVPAGSAPGNTTRR